MFLINKILLLVIVSDCNPLSDGIKKCLLFKLTPVSLCFCETACFCSSSIVWSYSYYLFQLLVPSLFR